MIQLNDIELDYKVGSFQHKVIALLSKQDSDTASLRRDSGVTVRIERAVEILNDMKQAKIIRSTATGWTITNEGLHASVLLGPVPETSLVKKRSRTDKDVELYNRPDYVPKELGMTCLRQGAYDAFILPSRISNELHYPNGHKGVVA